MSPDSEMTENARGGPKDAGGLGLGAWFNGPRALWLILVAAAIDSVIPLRVFSPPGGEIPGIAILMLLGFGIIALTVIWGLVALAALLPRKSTRLIVLLLMLLPLPSEISVFVSEFMNRPPTPEEERTGRAYFNTQPDRDLAVAIWECDPGHRADGAVCDPEKVRALARSTDTAKVGPGGVSHMSLTLVSGANPEIVRIVFGAGTPTKDVGQDALYRARDNLPLLHAVLDGGVDPNTRDQAGSPFVFWTLLRNEPIEEFTAYLDAFARVDDPDNEGYTPLMRAIYLRAYDKAEVLLARGAAEDHVAADGMTTDALIAATPP